MQDASNQLLFKLLQQNVLNGLSSGVCNNVQWNTIQDNRTHGFCSCPSHGNCSEEYQLQKYYFFDAKPAHQSSAQAEILCSKKIIIHHSSSHKYPMVEMDKRKIAGKIFREYLPGLQQSEFSVLQERTTSTVGKQSHALRRGRVPNFGPHRNRGDISHQCLKIGQIMYFKKEKKKKKHSWD